MVSGQWASLARMPNFKHDDSRAGVWKGEVLGRF